MALAFHQLEAFMLLGQASRGSEPTLADRVSAPSKAVMSKAKPRRLLQAARWEAALPPSLPSQAGAGLAAELEALSLLSSRPLPELSGPASGVSIPCVQYLAL